MRLMLFIALASQATALVARQDPPSARIQNGTIHGVLDAANNIDKFLGIPYAEPPVGNLRLAQAVALQEAFGTLEANAFGPSCYARGSQDAAVSEDCLTLNIWRPSGGHPDDGFPVMVWLYGGGLASGSAADPLFDGTNITRISQEIEKPIILVTLVRLWQL
jgi:carboxylesterase type B